MSENYAGQDLTGRDFSGQNLKGANFKRSNLSGANFTAADLRGASFREATLVNTLFHKANCGRRWQAVAPVLLVIFLVSILAGFLTTFSGIWATTIIEFFYEISTKQKTYQLISIGYFILICFSASLMFFISIQKRRFNLMTIVLSLAAVQSSTFALLTLTGVEATTIAMALTLGTVAIASATVAITIAAAAFVAVAFAGAVTGNTVGVLVGISAAGGGIAGAGAGCFLNIALAGYIAFRVHREDDQLTALRHMGLWLGSLGGTNFHGAILDGADFTGAILNRCRFHYPKRFHRVRVTETIGLKLAHLSGTIWRNRHVRDLCVTAKADPAQAYTGFILKGAHLAEADLSNADFTEADFSGAILEHANLQNATLAKAQMLGVELNGADLTGACLESWNIDSTTRLDGSHADFVYLRRDDKERRPASGVFGEGEFAKLFREVLDTVDFIFRDGIDWPAFVMSFDTLRERVRVESESGGEISIHGIENKGDGVFVVRVSAPHDIDKEALHAGLSSEYTNQLCLIEQRYQAMLEDKGREMEGMTQEIRNYRKRLKDFRRHNADMAEIAKTLASRNTTNIINAEATNMGKTINVYGDVTNAVLTLGDISGTVTNTIQQLPAASDPANPGPREKLTELQRLIENADEAAIPAKKKAQALAQTAQLAEAAAMDKSAGAGEAKPALAWFQSLAEALPTATAAARDMKRLVEELAKFW